MVQTKALGLSHLSAEILILFVHGKEGLHISIKSVLDTAADEAAVFSLLNPVYDAV